MTSAVTELRARIANAALLEIGLEPTIYVRPDDTIGWPTPDDDETSLLYRRAGLLGKLATEGPVATHPCDRCWLEGGRRAPTAGCQRVSLLDAIARRSCARWSE